MQGATAWLVATAAALTGWLLTCGWGKILNMSSAGALAPLNPEVTGRTHYGSYTDPAPACPLGPEEGDCPGLQQRCVKLIQHHSEPDEPAAAPLTQNSVMLVFLLCVMQTPCVFFHLLCQPGRDGQSVCGSRRRFQKLRTEASVR